MFCESILVKRKGKLSFEPNKKIQNFGNKIPNKSLSDTKVLQLLVVGSVKKALKENRTKDLESTNLIFSLTELFQSSSRKIEQILKNQQPWFFVYQKLLKLFQINRTNPEKSSVLGFLFFLSWGKNTKNQINLGSQNLSRFLQKCEKNLEEKRSFFKDLFPTKSNFWVCSCDRKSGFLICWFLKIYLILWAQPSSIPKKLA